jgi:hypothetical protein
MRQLHRFIIILLIIISIITLSSFLKPNQCIPDPVSEIDVYTLERSFIYNKSIDNFTRCILDMRDALNRLSIPWFITHGTALNYWRSKNFIADDMDVGVFYEDLRSRNLNEKDFLTIMEKKFHFRLSHSYGRLDHGQEWTFSCPQSQISIDIFVFYRFKEENSSFAYWTASYNGLCNEMIYNKCRWGFPKFNLTTFEMHDKKFHIVPLEFIIERYGKDYMIPKNYTYFESLTILPNLIPEHKNKTKNVKSRSKKTKHSLKFLRKRLRKRFFIKIYH